MPISENIARFIRAVATPTLRSHHEPGAAAIIVDTDTKTLKWWANGEKEAVDLAAAQTITGKKTFTGGIVGTTEVTTEATDTLLATESGKVFICTATSGTQVFTLPAAASAGLSFTFVCGHASSEIHVGVASGDNIVGKAHGAEDAGGLSTTATTGLLKNTAGTNVVGDHCTLQSDGVTTWYMTSVAGVWSAT